MNGEAHTRIGPRRGAKGESPSATLCEYIARRGLKRSRQRDRIAETFLSMPGHVSVEELVARVRKDDPRVAVATVYRTMKLLADCGLAIPRQFGGNHTRYEAAAGRDHHDHLICTVCGDIGEFANEKIESLQDMVARKHGFEVQSHKLELYGRCARCRRSPESRS